MLQQAHRTSPEATLYSMHARTTVNDLLDQAGPMLQAEVRAMADALGVVT